MSVLNYRTDKKKIFRATVPMYATLIAMILSGFTAYHFFPAPAEEVTVVEEKKECPEGMDILRNKDYKFTHPAYLYDVKNENEQLLTLKEKVFQYITKNKQSNSVDDISIYFRNLNNGAWFEINGKESFTPASLLQVAVLIATLKQAEDNPSFLDKKFLFGKRVEALKDAEQTFQLAENKSYSIKDLLGYMIEYSNDDATHLIMENLNRQVYAKLFTDLGIKPLAQDSKKGDNQMNIFDYSKFFRVLYNSSYINDEYSEFALSLLTKSAFKNGFLKNADPATVVAHHNSTLSMNKGHELHEVGIFYVEDQPYFLGVMTRGKDMNQLSTALSDISGMVHSMVRNVN
jgi:beta-lactamase class A